MAVFKNAFIKFESPRNVYYPGQIVKGNLEIEFDSPLTLSVIYLNYLGEAIVQWTEAETEEVNGRRRYKNVEYLGREEYFKMSQLLTGSYGSILNLNPGKHTYPFQFQLPRGIPSSFSGNRGKVHYSVIAHIECQGQSLIKENLVKNFEVIAPFDLNKGNASVKEPLELEFEEMYGCGCFCSSEPVSVRVRTPVSAYCPGQAIPVEVAVDNKSSVEIRSLAFELLKRERYRTQRPVAEYVQPEQVLTAVKKGSVMSGNKRAFTVDLVVPDMIVPNLEDCRIIDVGYFFRVSIKLSGCNDDLQDETEICLGLIPLQETVRGMSYVHPMSHSLPLGAAPAEEPQQTSRANQGSTQPPVMKVPEGTSYFVQVNEQVISSDPSQNYQMGFKAAYPPGSEVTFNQQFSQFNNIFDASMNLLDNSTAKFGPNVFPPRGKSPVPSAPPM